MSKKTINITLFIFEMLYLITGEWIEDPTVSLQEYATLWDQMVRPSLETLSNTADEKKTGGVFAGQSGSFDT